MVSKEERGGSDKQRGRGRGWQIVRKGNGERKMLLCCSRSWSCALVVICIHCCARSLSCVAGVVCVRYRSSTLVVVDVHGQADTTNFCSLKKRTLQNLVFENADTTNFCSLKKCTLQTLVIEKC